MSEHISDGRLALYAGGDLPSCDVTTVARHLRDCARCRAALTAFEETRNLLIALHGEPETRHVYEVHQRVTSRLHAVSGRKRWAWALAAAAVVALAIFGLRERPKTTDSMNVVAQLPSPPAPAPVIRSVPAVYRIEHRRKAGLRSVALITRADQPTLIRIRTADPNVVILWESNTKGETE